MKIIKKVHIDPGCISCGLCEFIAPDVFQVTDVCRIKESCDIQTNQEAIKQAARGCPVQVIQYEE